MKRRAFDWDQDYRRGQWDGVGDKDQFPRYVLLGGIMRRAGVRMLLDVGCGQALLWNFIAEGTLCSYTGIDMSQVALAGVREAQPQERFLFAPFEDWQAQEADDAVILQDLAKRMVGSLKEGCHTADDENLPRAIDTA